jgi:hypothetical protein
MLWANHERLRNEGVLLPGKSVQHWLAAQDLLEIEQPANYPFGPVHGRWERLARQARGAPDRAVIAHELLAGASPEQAARGVASLAPAEVHIVVTVRDIASLLPAEWQESVKQRNTRAWEDWLADVVDRESVDPDRRRFGFWRAHDTLEILRVWSAQVPPERVHVITVPPRRAGPDVLWQRYAGVLGADAAAADPARARSNVALGLAEVELLRRLNAALPRDLPEWFYLRNVKDAVAHGALATRSNADRLELPTERHDWAHDHAQRLVAGLRDAGYHLVGELDELLPAPPSRAPARPSDVPADAVLDAALTALTGLLAELGKTQGLTPVSAAEPGRPPGRVRSAVIALSERHPAVHRLRRGYWHLANAARHLRATARPERSAGDILPEDR